MAADAVAGAPVFIVAPWRRCGTTLLQRAFNSSGQAVVYGENFNFMENYPAIVAGVCTNVQTKQSRTDLLRRQVLDAGEDVDGSALFPDYGTYARLMRQHFYAMARYYQQETEKYGRHLWGLKHQIRRPEAFTIFVQLMPRARYIFVYRDVVDVARSDKARFPNDYVTMNAYTILGSMWARNTNLLRGMTGPNVLHLEFSELGDADAMVEKLSAHCGVSGIRKEVFARRINVSPVIDRLEDGEQRSGYRAPVALGEQERAALIAGVRRVGGGAAARMGAAIGTPANLN